MNSDQYWVRYRDVGIRSFPRTASMTIFEAYGRNQSFDAFMSAPNRVVVVRDPWHRLESVFRTFVNTKEPTSYNLPHTDDINEFLTWLLRQDPRDCDAHVTPMWVFLKNRFKPRNDELMVMDDFFAAPPHDLPRTPVHAHRTNKNICELGDVKVGLFRRWIDFATRDIKLFYRAQKSPLLTGGK